MLWKTNTLWAHNHRNVKSNVDSVKMINKLYVDQRVFSLISRNCVMLSGVEVKKSKQELTSKCDEQRIRIFFYYSS